MRFTRLKATRSCLILNLKTLSFILRGLPFTRKQKVNNSVQLSENSLGPVASDLKISEKRYAQWVKVRQNRLEEAIRRTFPV